MKKYRVKEGMIFQFTPLREGRPSRRTRQECRLCDFNSRPSARGDSKKCDLALDIYISIHAPPRGATLPDGASTTSFVAFQITPLREGRQSSIINGLQGDYFNSRPSARGDASRQCRASGSTTYFNSRPSARGDNRAERRKAARDIFQFTPLREGRLTMTTKPRNRVLFQFTPLREGRRALRFVALVGTHFNSRPSARGDHCVSPFLTQPAYFNSRPSARGDFA